MLRLRSWMFVPGHSEKMMSKVSSLDLDVAMFDLEDGVVPALKAEARSKVAALLDTAHGAAHPIRYVRVNGLVSGELDADLDAVVVEGLQGIVLPKVQATEEVQDVAAKLAKLENARGLSAGTVAMMLAIESAEGLLAAPQLATAVPRVSGLMFGAEDYSRDLGLPTVRTGHARDFTYARSAIIVAAAAARTASVDGVWPNLNDSDGLLNDARLGRDLGFTGKSLIHPGQIAHINEAFSPTPEELDYARRLIADFEQAVEEGRGSISFGGQLVDRPIYERACATVRLGERAENRGAAS